MIERKRSLSPLKDSPRSITSGPKSPAQSIFSKETRDSDHSPTTTAVNAIMDYVDLDSMDGAGTVASSERKR